MTRRSGIAGPRTRSYADVCRALDEHPNQRASNAVRIQLLTGARLGEVLKAERADFDLARGVWTKSSHHTKQKRREHVSSA